MMQFGSIFEYLTFANVVHCIHIASTIHLVTMFTLKIRKKELASLKY